MRVCGAAVFLALLGTQSLRAQVLDLGRIQRVADSLARTRIAAGQSPGLGLAVGHKGEVVFEKGYGLADVELDVAAGPQTLFQIASVTKQFTAAAVMRLIERGTIGLDDPITKYLPDYPTQGHTVTIRHLLNHTSGIKSFTGVREGLWEREFRLGLTYPEMLDLFAKVPFDFAPGTRYAYNNSGYYLLGEIIGRVTRVPYAEYIEHDLLTPLGLDDVVYCDERRIIRNRAEGYDLESGKLVNAAYTSVSTFSPASGGLCATLGGLIRWTHLLHSGQVVSPASLALMTTPTVTTRGDTVTYGFGLHALELEGRRKIAHSGSRPGFSAYLAHYPERGFTTVVLANGTAISATGTEESLARALLGIELLDLPLAAAEITRDEGTYILQLGGGRTREMQVFAREGRLMLRLQGEGTSRLLHQGDGAFVAEANTDFRFVFPRDGSRAESVTLRTGRQELRGARKQQ